MPLAQILPAELIPQPTLADKIISLFAFLVVVVFVQVLVEAVFTHIRRCEAHASVTVVGCVTNNLQKGVVLKQYFTLLVQMGRYWAAKSQ